MKRPGHLRKPGILGWIVVGLLATSQSGAADEPVLAIHTPGSFHSYLLSDVERVDFVGDSLLVATASTSDIYALSSIVKIDFSSIMTAVENPEVITSLPKIFNLFPNQPNPLSSETKITFHLPQAGQVELEIYAVSGRLVRTLISENLNAGHQSRIWDGLDNSGLEAPTGVYFYRLVAPGVEESRRMILLR